MKRSDAQRARAGLALMPMIGVLVLLTLLGSLLARKQVRGHRAAETLNRRLLARQIVAGEAQRLGLGLTAALPVDAGRRLLSPADVPGLPEPVAVEVTALPGQRKAWRVEVQIPADAVTNFVRESLEIR